VDSISAYVATDNGKAADELLDRFGRVFEMLVQNPQAGRRRPDLGQNLRSFPVGRYIIIYAPVPDGIEVVRVIHGRQDINLDDVK
jgi:toxin ParE1/3/4